MLYVSISEGNMKLKDVPSVSLLPGHACVPSIPCLKKCYAKKTCTSYPAVGRAWAGNYILATTDPEEYFKQIRAWLTKKAPKFFRWHVGGDILDQAYYHQMASIAGDFPKIRFMCYTKRQDLEFNNRPFNLTVILSRWPGVEIKPRNMDLAEAWMSDPKEPDIRIPVKHLECPGSCDACGHKCWFLKRGQSVVFHKH